ncbi:MAG: AAA family ATPase [Thiolinea sp.]
MQQKIPYGLSNFKTVISEQYVYVDKTRFIAELERNGRHHILLRPRRFGKSLWLSALEYYYDVNAASVFTELFGHLDIGRHPTPLKNSYQVLFMEFSGISTQDSTHILSSFNTTIDVALGSFLRRYDYPEDIRATILDKNTPEEKVKPFMEAVEQSGQKILLLIDEYDHFANSILADNLQLFQQMVGKGGFVRSFYETLKAATQRGVIDRLFITGVTPVMLDSLTSGFNIGENLSFTETFNECMGFTRAEVETLVQPLIEKCELDQHSLMQDITHWYNGYRFHMQAAERMYNSDMVLYFIKNYDYKRCTYPKRMLDMNIASDYGKILGLFSIGDRDRNYQVLETLLNEGEVIAEQAEKFDFDKGFTRDDFISLLAYMGFATPERETLAGDAFVIPNQVMRELYFRYFKVELERLNDLSISTHAMRLAVEALALRADMQPLITELERVLQLLSNRDALWLDEEHIKTILLTLLYQSSAYFIQSEREMNRRYPDILLLERSPYKVAYQHLIELKYSRKKAGSSGWQARQNEGWQQVQEYLQLPDIKALSGLKAWLIVTDGERISVENVAI